jgi:hypothetical protein
VQIVYNNAGSTRNDPLNNRLSTALQAAAAAAGIDRIVVTSGGQEAEGEGGARTGSTRHDHGNAADVELYVGGRLLDFTNSQDQALYQQFVTAAASNGVTGIGAGSDYMGNSRIHVGFGAPAVWGAGGSSANAPDWLRAAYNAGTSGLAYVPQGQPTGAQAAANQMGSQGTTMPTDRPILSAMASNWQARARGEKPLKDAAQRFFERIRNGERPIANGIANFFERLAQRPREGTEATPGNQPSGVLGQPMNMTQWQTPQAPPTGAATAPPAGQVPVAGDQRGPPPQGSIDPFNGPHAEYVAQRLTQLLPILPSNVQQGLAPMLAPQQSTPRTMPTQMPQTGQSQLPTAQAPPQPTPPPPPIQPQPDWNPWAMLTGPMGGGNQLRPPQSMPGMPEPLANFETITPGFGPFPRPGLRPPTNTPPRMGGFSFQPRMRFGGGVLG